MRRRTNRTGRLVAVHDRHLNIHQHGIEIACGHALEPLQRLLSVDRPLTGDALAGQKLLQNLRVDVVVLRHQNPDALQRSGIGVRRVRRLRAAVRRLCSAAQLQLHPEGASLARRAVHGDGSTHHVHEASGDRHAQPRARHAAGGRVVLPGKGIEDVLLERRADADAVVLHLEAQVCVAPGDLRQALDGQRNPSALGRILDGVGQQVLQNLAEPSLIAQQRPVAQVGRRYLEHLLLFQNPRPDDRLQLFQELPRRKRHHIQRLLSALNLRHLQHVVDQVQQVPSRGGDLPVVLPHLVRLSGVPLQQGREAHDRVHGGSHIMAHVGQEHGLGLVGCLRRPVGLLHRHAVFQLRLLQLGHILYRHQDGDGNALPPLQAQHRNLRPAHALLLHPVLILQKGRVLRQVLLNRADGQLVPYLRILLNDPFIPVVPEPGVGPLPRENILVPIAACLPGGVKVAFQIFIGIVLKVHQHKSVEQPGGALHNLPHLLLFHDQLRLLLPVLHNQQQDIDRKQQHQPQLQIHGDGVRLLQHGIGHLNGENLQQHPVLARQLRDIRRVGALPAPVGQALGLPVLQRLNQRIPRLLIRALRLLQRRDDIFRLVGIVGAGEHAPVGQAQIGRRRFLKVGGTDHLLHLMLAVPAREDADNLPLMPQRGIEDHQVLVGKSPVEDDVHAGMTAHAVRKVEPVRHLRLSAVVVRIDALGIDDAHVVEGGIIHHPLENANVQLIRRHGLPAQMGDGHDAVLRADQNILDAPGSLRCRVRDVIRVSGHGHPEVHLHVHREAGNHAKHQQTCRDNTLPDRPFPAHQVLSPLACNILSCHRPGVNPS